MRRQLYLLFATSITIAAATLYAQAQEPADALRFSYQSPQGTARSMGFGGALGSVGGDFTSVTVNPAGLGIYRNSEFMFTPTIKINNVNGTYNGTKMDDNANQFSINNLGVVFASSAKGRRYDRSKWKSVVFAMGINRIADFNRSYTYGGYNGDSVSGSSITELFALDANNYPGDSLNLGTLAGIGYGSFLIDRFGGNSFQTVVPWYTGINQRRTVRERGGITDLSFSLGGNYEEKMLFGVTIGLPIARYVRDVTYEETDATDDPNNYFSSLSYKESLTTSGIGVNLKLGFIYKPVDAFRVGVALHTPTYYGLTDVQNRSITTNTENFKYDLGYTSGSTTILQSGVDIPENTFEYGIITPWKGILSAAGIIGKHGFITADYEYVNYRSMRFNYDPFYAENETNINQFIKNNYRGASNIRVGGEARFDIVSLRLGFGFYGSPYKTSVGGADRIDLSAGVGFRFGNFFTDLGFVNTQYTQEERPYNLDVINIDVQKATLKNSFNTAALTFGWKF